MGSNNLTSNSFDLDFDEFLVFVKTNIPNALFINNASNKDLFLSINTGFKLSDILTDFEFATPSENYFNLLVEYKKYFARVLSAVCLNDKFLIDNILRLLTEKLYRIITGLSYPNRGERRIRSDSRLKMRNDLASILDTTTKTNIDSLYSDLSNAIHNTNSNPIDLYDIRRLFITPSSNITDTLVITNTLTNIFIDEVFIKLCSNKREICGTNFLIRMRNNLPTPTANSIITKLGL